MRFGEQLVDHAAGAILGHSVKHAAGVFKKGRVLTEADVAVLREAGVSHVFVARLEEGDVTEDVAAGTLASVAGGVGTSAQAPFTGRANLHAATHGVAVVDVARVREINRLHESLTLATVASHSVVEARQMIATFKVIPFAVPGEIVERALSVIGQDPLIRVETFRHRNLGLVITRLPQTKQSIVTKSEQAMRDRIAALDGELTEVRVVPHAIGPVQDAIAELKAKHCHPILVFGASAIVDRGDVIPAGLTAAGGEVVHLGMPVDPGNLMMFGRIEGVPVIGVPSCARSPKVNGFDWVLERVMAGLHLSREDIMDMGAGGLLAEIPTRPLPREGKPKVQTAPRIAAIVLAAGQSSRMGFNKLLAEIDGEPMIRQTVKQVLGSSVEWTIVVTGRDADDIRKSLKGLDVRFIHNEGYAAGLSTSLRRGLEDVPIEADAVLVCLGDMPLVSRQVIERLVAAFNPAEHRSVCVPLHGSEKGNPVLWGRQHFDQLAALSGDRGGRVLLDQLPEEVVEVPMNDAAVLRDADTPEALTDLRSGPGL